MKKLFLLLTILLVNVPFISKADVGEEFYYDDFGFVITSEEDHTVGLFKYRGTEENVTIPEEVTFNDVIYTVTGFAKLGYSPVFFGNQTMKSVTIPSCFTFISYGAFMECSNLVEVNLPESLQFIEGDSFQSCSSLKTIVIPKSVTRIDGAAFRGCSNLENIILPENLTTISQYLFDGCSKLIDLTIPSSVTEIGKSAFSGCTSLVEIELPESITVIDWWTFKGCTSLESIVIPDSVKTIDNEAFDGCSSLKNVVIGKSVETIENYSFNGCPIETLTINTPIVDTWWFRGIKTLTKLNLTETVTTVNAQAFNNCSITELSLPLSLTSIGNEAFRDNKIRELTLPKNLTNIGVNAFKGCPVEKLTVNTSANINNVFSFDNLTDAIFADDATTIPSFADASRLRNVKFPSSMTILPDYAFLNCTSLENIELPIGVKSIGDRAFQGCTSLKAFNFSENIETLGDGAFALCNLLSSMKIPDKVTVIPDNLFYGCIGLEKVYLHDNISSLGASAFNSCYNLRSLIIPDGIKSIPDNMMYRCSSLTEIRIPNSVTSIGEYAFYGCSSLKNIDLGTGVYDIGNYAFDNSLNVVDIRSMAKNPPYAYQYTFPVASYTNAIVTVQEQSLLRYTQENPWYRFDNYMTVGGTISLSHYQVDMAGNEVFQLGVYGANSEIEWTSTNPAVAYANKCGLIVAMGITGSTTITAHVGDEEINCRVTVSALKREKPAKTLAYSNADETEAVSPVEIYVEGVSGNPPMVNVRLIPVGASTVIDWTTSDESLATVQNGIVNVIGEGEVEFGAETDNGLSESLEADTSDLENGDAGVEFINSDEKQIVKKDNNIYDISGRCVIVNATHEQIESLKKGIYIINGEKLLVK